MGNTCKIYSYFSPSTNTQLPQPDCTNTVMGAKIRKNRELKASKNFRNETLSNMFNNTKTGKFCDAVFVVEGRELYAHKAVLADVSPVVEAMLTSGMKESQSGRLTEVARGLLLRKLLMVFLRIC